MTNRHRWSHRAVLALLCVLVASGCAAPEPEPFDPEAVEDAVEAMLLQQVEDWNAFDIEAFMKGYWNSPDLRFASGGSVRSGWQETLERYRRTYPDAAAMGRLSFEEIDVRALSPEVALAFGRWRLMRHSDEPTGLFTLLVQLKDGEWRIVHDHTSNG